MKIIGTFAVVMAASIALLQPAEGRPRGGGRSFSSGHNFSSGSARHFSSGPRNFSPGYTRSYRSAQPYSAQPSYRHRAYSSNSSRRFSSQAASRNRSSNRRYGANRTADLNRRAGSDSQARFAPNRRSAGRSAGFNNNGGRVEGHQTRNWNRNRDYHWRGNRCRWRNNSWVIIGPWYPWGYGWGYGYYPYASYSYYDDRYYDDGYAASEDSQYEYDSGNADSRVSQVQAALAREGYYHGAIDGSIGPATRNALRRYQRNQGLDATGRIDRAVIEALGLG